ncbi:MAG: DUF3459 domain-containing protein [Austwickia sp.]|nr:DUF3459 domain-containing protein [Austwickia sp.]
MVAEQASGAAGRVARDFQVWAPHAQRGVDLDLAGVRHRMAAGPGGWWMVTVEAAVGDAYGFCIDGGPALADPAARALPDGPAGLARVLAARSGAAAATADHPSWPGLVAEGVVAYDLGLARRSSRATFDAVSEQLDYLADLGVSLLLLGPVALAGDREPVRYDVRSPRVIDRGYGGPRRLRALVAACHSRGIGVGVDLVMSCSNPDGSPWNHFGPYYHAAPHTDSGWAPNLDGPGSDDVRAFWLATALDLVTEFDLDALRLRDAGELADRRAITFVEELATTMAELGELTGRPRWLILDDDRSDSRTVQPVSEGGLGCSAMLVDDLGRGLWDLASADPQQAAGMAARVLGDPLWTAGAFSPRHGRTNGRPVDPELVPGWRFLTGLLTPGARPPQPDQLGVRRWCVMVALALTSATTPLLMLGEEWGFTGPGQAFAPVNAADGADPRAHRLRSWYRALLALRAARPQLREPTLSKVAVRAAEQPGVFVVHRGGHRIAVNLGVTRAVVDLGLPTSHRQVVLLSLDPTTAVSYQGTVELPPDGVAVIGPASISGGAS